MVARKIPQVLYLITVIARLHVAPLDAGRRQLLLWLLLHSLVLQQPLLLALASTRLAQYHQRVVEQWQQAFFITAAAALTDVVL